MLDNLIREFERLKKGTTISVQIKTDDAGFFDRVCPRCDSPFKVEYTDWKEKISARAVYCPLCRHEAPSDDWFTPEQKAYLRKAVRAHLQGPIRSALQRDVRAFNRGQPRGGFPSMKMSVRSGTRPVLVTPEVCEAMTQRSACQLCHCRYASIGAAFFCPACGHNSAPATFASSVETVRRTLSALPALKKVLVDTQGRDSAEDALRLIREQSLCKLVSSYQRLAEALFESLPNASDFKPRRNVFQTLDEASELWCRAIGVGYGEMMSVEDFAALKKYFQQRHVIEHKEGIVDALYLEKSGDLSLSVGQRLSIGEREIRELADLVETLSLALKDRIGT